MENAAIRNTSHPVGLMLCAGCAALIAVILMGAAAIFAPAPAQARPAFAQQTGFTCNRCHTTPPQLTSYGKAFKAAGNQVPKKK
jgi:hypothetical protein